MNPRTLVALVAVLLAVLLAASACGAEGPCRAETFGRQCGDDGTSVERCVREDNSTCQIACYGPATYRIDNQACPAWQPVCSSRDDTALPDVVCVGERLGSCDAEGFVRCEGLDQVVLCVPQEDGSLIESRGPCGADHVCLPPEVGESAWAGGCLRI